MATHRYCGLADEIIEPDDFRDAYVEVMHRETRRLARTSELPLLEPEQDT
jgi:hypothetical protein